MKISKEHFDYLTSKIQEVIAENPTMYDNYMKEKFSHMRYNWDLLWMADLTNFTTNDLYEYLNDTHIDTALKAITGKA